MPIDERRELNKSSTRYKNRAHVKTESVPVTYSSDGKFKASRGRARSRKEPPASPVHPEYPPKGKEQVKSDDQKRCISPPKQSLKKDNAKSPDTKGTQSMARLKASSKGAASPANVSLEAARANAHPGSQRSLELMFIRKRDAAKEAQTDSPRMVPNVIPVRRNSVSPKASPTIRPSTAPAPLGKSVPSFPKGICNWRSGAPTPEVLLWIPQGTSLEEASERAKHFLTGNFPPRPPSNRQAPVITNPVVTNRKVEVRPYSASCRKMASRGENASRGSTPIRPNELWRNRFSRLLQKNMAPGESTTPKSHSPQEGRSRPQSPATRAWNDGNKRRTLGAVFHPPATPKRNERSRLTELTAGSSPTMPPQRWGKRPDSVHAKKMVHMCKSCAPVEGKFFSEMAAFLPVRKDTLVILKPYECRTPHDSSPLMQLQKSFSETTDTILSTTPVTIRKLESASEMIQCDLSPNYSQKADETTTQLEITESDAEFDVIKEPSVNAVASTPSSTSPEKVHSPVNMPIPLPYTESLNRNAVTDRNCTTCLEAEKDVIKERRSSDKMREKSQDPEVDPALDSHNVNAPNLQGQSSNCNSVNTNSSDTIVAQVSKSYTENSKTIANEERPMTNMYNSCDKMKIAPENPPYFPSDSLGKSCTSSSTENLSDKTTHEAPRIFSPKSFHRKSSSSVRIPTPHMSEVFSSNKIRNGGMPSTTIAKLLSPAMVGSYPKHKMEETQPQLHEKEVLQFDAKLDSVLQTHRLSGCSLDQYASSSVSSRSSNMEYSTKNGSSPPTQDPEQQKLAHNVYVTYVSPLIVQSQGSMEDKNSRKLSNIMNDLNREILRTSVLKPSKRHIPTTLNSIKEEASQNSEKQDNSGDHTIPTPQRETTSLLSNIRLMQKHISAIRENGSQGCPHTLEKMVIPSPTSKSSVLDPGHDHSGAAGSRVRVTESFWTALDRLVQCQEEVINAFASYSDSCGTHSTPFGHRTMQSEEDSPSRASEESPGSSSATAEEEERSLGTWEVPPLSDSYESEEDFSSARQDRTYHLATPTSLPRPPTATLTITMPPGAMSTARDSTTGMSDAASTRKPANAEFAARGLVSLTNTHSSGTSAGKSTSSVAGTTAGAKAKDDGKWRNRALQAKAPRRALPPKGLRALKARAGVTAPARRSVLWRKGPARSGHSFTQQVAAAAMTAYTRGKVRVKSKERARSLTPGSSCASRRRRSSVSPSVSPSISPSSTICHPMLGSSSHPTVGLIKSSTVPTLVTKGAGNAVLSLTELLKQATGTKLSDVDQDLAARLKKKAPRADAKDVCLGKDEEVICPDARCSVRLTPQTLLAHLAVSHRQALSTITRPGHPVSVSLRPADLMPAVPCIAAFLHVTDRMDFGPFLLMVATSRDAGSGNSNGSSPCPASSSFTSSGLGAESSSSASCGEGVASGARVVLPALPPPPPTSPRPDITLIAWLVEIHPRSSCTVRVLRRCDCSRRLCAAASYTGDTVALRRSQRLEDVLATGAYVVAHPQLLARLQQCGGEVEVSATVLPGYSSDEDEACGDDWSLREDSSAYEGGLGEFSIVEEETEVSEESANPSPLHACLTIPCA